MMTKKEVVEHVLDIYMEMLVREEIGLKYLDEQGEDLPEATQMQFQAQRQKVMSNIEGWVKQIEIAKKMLKEME